MSEILAVRDVVKTFGDVRAVDGVSFSIRRGTITGLLGRNGAWKTTTIRMITGIFMPDAGSIEWLGSENDMPFSLPSHSIDPASGMKMPVIMRIVVVFQAPLRPRRPVIVPRRIEKETPSTARTSPNVLTTSRTARISDI